VRAPIHGAAVTNAIFANVCECTSYLVRVEGGAIVAR